MPALNLSSDSDLLVALEERSEDHKTIRFFTVLPVDTTADHTPFHRSPTVRVHGYLLKTHWLTRPGLEVYPRDSVTV